MKAWAGLNNYIFCLMGSFSPLVVLCPTRVSSSISCRRTASPAPSCPGAAPEPQRQPPANLPGPRSASWVIGGVVFYYGYEGRFISSDRELRGSLLPPYGGGGPGLGMGAMGATSEGALKSQLVEAVKPAALSHLCPTDPPPQYMC